MFEIHEFKKLDFKQSIIEDLYVRYTDDLSYNSLYIEGKFRGTDDRPHFDLCFELYPEELSLPDGVVGAEIVNLEVEPSEGYSVKLDYMSGDEHGRMEFLCKDIELSRLKYRGFSYRNVYPEWLDAVNKLSYEESPEYLDSKDIRKFDGFIVNTRLYFHPGDTARERDLLKVFELTGIKFTYVYRALTRNKEFFSGGEIIHHSNGRRYFTFGVDMYGISFLDLDSGEAYNYIPEGFEHSVSSSAIFDIGESFIILKAFYDPSSDLIAYEGCYWAANCDDVMVGDLSNPLDFDPHLISIQEIIDPEREEFDDINFLRFENGKLVVSCDGICEREISCADILKKIKSMGARS